MIRPLQPGSESEDFLQNAFELVDDLPDEGTLHLDTGYTRSESIAIAQVYATIGQGKAFDELTPSVEGVGDGIREEIQRLTKEVTYIGNKMGHR